MSTSRVDIKRQMDERTRLSKNSAIKKTLKKTKKKRKKQVCKVVKVKIQSNKLNLRQKEALKMLFVEGKWLKNDILRFSENDKLWNYQISGTVNVLNKDKKLETREYKHLGSQMKQSIMSEMIANIKTLASLKEQGLKVGRLKFIKEMREINLKQHKVTFRIKSDTKMKIQNVPGFVRVNGLNQLRGMDIASAKLLNKADGYYLAITAYQDKAKIKENYSQSVIGIDMGIQTNITTSNGDKINVLIDETEHLKRLQQKFARQKKGSNGYRKTQKKINIEYQKISNRKNDAANKIVHEILSNEFVFMQDEQIAEWKKDKRIHGSRKIHHSVLGRVKAKLIDHPRVVVLDKFVPTTATCKCGEITKTPLSQRIFKCDKCGYELDRDIHASLNMIRLGKEKLIPVDRRKYKLVETLSASLESLIQVEQKPGTLEATNSLGSW
jgi:putative transposase